jgi:menaquinone-dependent protoporphyrinogen oxidase
MRLFYATRDGQAQRIAQRIAQRLNERGAVLTPQDLALAFPPETELSGASLVIVIAAVRYGRHLPEADRLLALLRRLPSAPPLVLVSVNLTARKPGKDSATGNAYLRKWIARHRLHPLLATAVAGRLDYPRYTWSDRLMIRFIMMLTGGPTDPRAVVEYTAWDAVDAFAERIGALPLTRGRSDRE